MDGMYKAINDFSRQFEYEPIIQNPVPTVRFKQYVILGMGGSQLPGRLLGMIEPSMRIINYPDYGLPFVSREDALETLYVANSYSGNTEETINGFEEAVAQGYNIIAISIGGKLLELAKKYKKPYIQIPDTGIQPRCALGFNVRAMLKAIGDENLLAQTGELSHGLETEFLKGEGQALAKTMKGFVPVIYSSNRNTAVAYIWKIKFNETGKIPAFYNVFPEMNHNEMNGFDVQLATKHLSQGFYFLFLKDDEDNPRVTKRMEIVKHLYEARKLVVKNLELKGKNRLHTIFSSLVLADWASYYTAIEYGVDPEQVPMVEQLKKMI